MAVARVRGEDVSMYNNIYTCILYTYKRIIHTRSRAVHGSRRGEIKTLHKHTLFIEFWLGESCPFRIALRAAQTMKHLLPYTTTLGLDCGGVRPQPERPNVLRFVRENAMVHTYTNTHIHPHIHTQHTHIHTHTHTQTHINTVGLISR